MGYLTIQEQNFYIDSVQEMPWVILLELAMNSQVRKLVGRKSTAILRILSFL